MNNGDLVPTHLLEEFLKTKIIQSQNQDILLTEFPRTIEQFLMLKNLLVQLTKSNTFIMIPVILK